MNLDEITQLLRAAAARDNRKVTRERAEAWLEDLGDLPYGLAHAALVLHYRTSTEYLMSAHIRDNAAFLVHAHRRDQRLQRQAAAADIDHKARDSRPLADRSPEVQARVRDIASRLTTPTSQALTARWRARRITTDRSASANPPPAPAAPPEARPRPANEADITRRESQAVQALHAAGRPCGSPACTRTGCGAT